MPSYQITPVSPGGAKTTGTFNPRLVTAVDAGVALSYELHPGSDLYDRATYVMFLEAVDQHPAMVGGIQ